MFIPKISVIIPVYNAEKYIHQCIDSIISQPMKDLEIICVNDGSTDNSPAILDEYVRKYNNIKVIHQNNQHLGPARNNGMKISTGEYVHFLDADDYLVENAYQAVYEEAKRHDADILKFRVHTMDAVTGEDLNDGIYNLSKIPEKYFGEVLNFLEYPEAFTPGSISYPPWNSLYKRLFVQKNNIQFDLMHTFEDHAFYYTVLLNADRVIYSDNYVLTYRKNISTSLFSGGLNHFECLFEVYRLLNERTRFLPHPLRYLILGIELKEMFYWYSRSSESSQNWEYIKSATFRFINNIDSYDFNEIIQTERWNCNYQNKLAGIFPSSMEQSKTDNQRITILQQAYYKQQFPFDLIKKGSKVAIYGAGGFGKIAVSIMNETGYGKPSIWVDKNYVRLSDDAHEISNPTEIAKNNFDFVVIAIEDKGTIMDIQRFLLNNGIPQNKIIWRDSELNIWVNEKL